MAVFTDLLREALRAVAEPGAHGYVIKDTSATAYFIRWNQPKPNRWPPYATPKFTAEHTPWNQVRARGAHVYQNEDAADKEAKALTDWTHQKWKWPKSRIKVVSAPRD